MKYLVFLLLLSTPIYADEEDSLLMIIAVTRHGDRAAENDVPITGDAANAVFYRGGGEMTDSGLRHAKEVGSAYRTRYVSTGWLDGRFLPNQTAFQASAVNRVLMSAGEFSSGLFQANLIQPVHSPIYTIPYADDPLLAIQFQCLNAWEDVQEDCHLNNTINAPEQLLTCMRSSQWPCGNDPPADKSDTLLSEFANLRTRIWLTSKESACAQGPARRFMFTYIQRLGGSGPRLNLVRLKRTVGNLTDSIVMQFRKRMEECQADGPCNLPSAVFYNAHDVNIVSVMDAFSDNKGAESFFNGLTPAFAASLSIELWSRRGEPYVKMWLINGAGQQFEEFKYCSHLPQDFSRIDSFCTLASLEKAKNMMFGDVVASCTVTPEDPAGCCPEGGVWTEWSTQGVCPTTCGSNSNLTRTRTCVSQADGCPCTGVSSDIGPCGTALCPWPGITCFGSYVKTYDNKTMQFYCGMGDEMKPPEHPCCPDETKKYWTPWTEWSPANTCLTTGGRTRSRICNGVDKGCLCDGETGESEACCCPSGGVWGEWAPVSGTCATSCGSCTTVKRTRTCSSEKYGCPCTGVDSDTGPCNRTPCPSGQICCTGFSVMTNPNSGIPYCGTNETQVPLSPCCTSENAGTWGEWTEWTGACNIAPCGLCDTQKRERICTLGPIGCPCDGNDTDTRGCGNNSLCPFPSSHTCCPPSEKSLINNTLICA